MKKFYISKFEKPHEIDESNPWYNHPNTDRLLMELFSFGLRKGTFLLVDPRNVVFKSVQYEYLWHFYRAQYQELLTKMGITPDEAYSMVEEGHFFFIYDDGKEQLWNFLPLKQIHKMLERRENEHSRNTSLG